MRHNVCIMLGEDMKAFVARTAKYIYINMVRGGSRGVLQSAVLGGERRWQRNHQESP